MNQAVITKLNGHNNLSTNQSAPNYCLESVKGTIHAVDGVCALGEIPCLSTSTSSRREFVSLVHFELTRPDPSARAQFP